MKRTIIPFIFISLLLGGCGTTTSSLSNTSSDTITSSSDSTLEIKNLKEALKELYNSKNYTLDIYKSNQYMYSWIYSNSYIGIFSKNSINDLLNVYIEDNDGIYRLETYRDVLTPSLYIKDENEVNIKNLWYQFDSQTFYGKSLSYIESINENSVQITDKLLKLTILKSIGLESSSIVDLESINATFENSKMNFTVKFLSSSDAISIDVNLLEYANISEVDSYISNGGTAFIPDNSVSNFVRLMKLNNYVSDTYDINEKAYIAYEIFNPHYFIQQYNDSTMGSGMLEIFNSSTLKKGSYSCQVLGSFENGYTEAGVVTSFPYTEYELEIACNYPSNLKIVAEPQYIEQSNIPTIEYQPKGETFYIEDYSLLVDFAKNFSLDKTWDLSTYPPQYLGIDLVLNENDTTSEITFLYYFKNGNAIVEYPIHYHDFGNANITILDNAYAKYNK